MNIVTLQSIEGKADSLILSGAEYVTVQQFTGWVLTYQHISVNFCSHSLLHLHHSWSYFTKEKILVSCIHKCTMCSLYLWSICNKLVLSNRRIYGVQFSSLHHFKWKSCSKNSGSCSSSLAPAILTASHLSSHLCLTSVNADKKGTGGGGKHVLKKMKPSFSFILSSLNELPGKYESFSCCLQEAK